VRKRRRLLPAVCLLVLAGTSVEARYVRGTTALLKPERVRITSADAQAARAVLPGLVDASFRTDDGLLLRGYYVPSRNGAVVVMGHGIAANRMYFLPDAEMLARHGYGALFFDWRAHGESEGELSTWGDREQRDLRAALDFVSNLPDVSQGRIAVLGFSSGASAVALGAAADPRARAVILEAPYTSFDEELRSKMSGRGFLSLWPALLTVRYYGIDTHTVRPVDEVAAIAPRPVLFIVGARDDDTPEPVVRRVYDAALEPKRIWVVDGARHGDYQKVAPEGCAREIIGFLDEALFGAKADAQ
jgi:pimeloyl-ACP methyl ester carboxylesterase